MRSRNSNLHTAWEQALQLLEVCFTQIREMDGYEQAVLTVSIKNGTTIHAFTLPAEFWKEGVPGCIIHANDDDNHLHSHLNEKSSSQKRRTELIPLNSSEPTNTQMNCEHWDFTFIEALNMAELKRFLSKIRDDLGLRTFSWPTEAQRYYRKITDEVLPTAPGRSTAKKRNLILILKLSIQHDTAWRKAVSRTTRIWKSHCEKNGDQAMPMPQFSPSTQRRRNGKQDPKKGLNISRLQQQEPDIGKQNQNVDLALINPLLHSNCEYALRSVGKPGISPVSLPTSAQLIAAVQGLPQDNLQTSTNRSNWKDLYYLLRSVRHPPVPQNCHWFKQQTPPDGNCLFSAVMVAAGNRIKAFESISTVAGLRKSLGAELKHLARAGLPNSKFRRDWLVSCLYDIDEMKLRELCEPLLSVVRTTSRMEDMELLLIPLRLFVQRWATMVERSHWGGLLTAELSVLATITGTAIEVLRGADEALLGAEHTVTLCDTVHGDGLIACTRSGLYLPVKAVLPSPEDGFLPVAVNEDISAGWVGQYPVMRVVLQGRHYDACTSNHSYPVSTVDASLRLPLTRWFTYVGTLAEPYSSLGEEEEAQLQKASFIIQQWSETSQNNDGFASYLNSTLSSTNGGVLTASSLSRLRVPPLKLVSPQQYMLSDDLISSYMELLSARADRIAADALMEGQQSPPKTMYMQSYLFQSAARGPNGPAAKKKRNDLLSYSQILIPALVDGHWLLAICYPQQKCIGVYDPLGDPRKDVFEVVRKWATIKIPSTTNSPWIFLHIKECRNCVQKGIVDCGIFICKAAESFGLGIPLRISQCDIPYVRRRMLLEFIRQEATTIRWLDT